jgi:hypothetical protein
MSCEAVNAPGLLGLGAAKEEYKSGSLGQGKLDGEDRVVQTPTPLSSMAGIRISSVSAGCGFNAAVSAARYTPGVRATRDASVTATRSARLSASKCKRWQCTVCSQLPQDIATVWP